MIKAYRLRVVENLFDGEGDGNQDEADGGHRPRRSHLQRLLLQRRIHFYIFMYK